jgi:hypothetical protein
MKKYKGEQNIITTQTKGESQTISLKADKLELKIILGKLSDPQKNKSTKDLKKHCQQNR